MDHVYVGEGLRLTYVRDPHTLEHIIREAREADTFANRRSAWFAQWASRRYRGGGHLVVANDRSTGLIQGFLLAQERQTTEEPFLLLEETPFVTRPTDPATLRRMIALVILRTIGLGQLPGVIVGRTYTPALCDVLHDLSRRVASAVFYPAPGSNVIPLSTAALAHRLARAMGQPLRSGITAAALRQDSGRHDGVTYSSAALPEEGGVPMLAVLDLRDSDEASLVEGAGELLRARVKRTREIRTSGTVRNVPRRLQVGSVMNH